MLPTSHVSHVEVHTPIATIRIDLGQGLREPVRQILTCGDTEHLQTFVNMLSFPSPRTDKPFAALLSQRM